MTCKGPFKSWQGHKVYLLVDGIWKDPKNRNGYTLNIQSNQAFQCKKVENEQ